MAKREPDLVLAKIKKNTLKELSGSVIIKEYGDINEPVLLETTLTPSSRDGA